MRQARRPELYARVGVADTVDGRFGLIALHAYLVLRRLKRDRARTADFAQAFFDLMFADMDENLRELGVGDLALGKRIRAMAEMFYGRIAAYDAALAAADADLAEALERTLFRETRPRAEALQVLTAYVRRQLAALDGQVTERLLEGEVTFEPDPALPRSLDGRPVG